MIPFFKKAAKSLLLVCFLFTLTACQITQAGIFQKPSTNKPAGKADAFIAEQHQQKASASKAGQSWLYESNGNHPVIFSELANVHCGGVNRTDGISYDKKSGTLTVHTGKLNDKNDIRYVHGSKTYRLSANYERVVMGDFYGHGCDSALLYDTAGMKAELWKNNGRSVPFYKPSSFEKTLHTGVSVNDQLFSETAKRYVDDFTRRFGGAYIVLAGKANHDDKDDLIFVGITGQSIWYTIVYAGHQSRRSDNLMFDKTSGQPQRISNMLYTKGMHFPRFEDVDGDGIGELVVVEGYNKYMDELRFKVSKLTNGKFGTPKAFKLDATYIREAFKDHSGSKPKVTVGFAEMNKSGPKELVVLGYNYHPASDVKIPYAWYADFSKLKL